MHILNLLLLSAAASGRRPPPPPRRVSDDRLRQASAALDRFRLLPEGFSREDVENEVFSYAVGLVERELDGGALYAVEPSGDVTTVEDVASALDALQRCRGQLLRRPPLSVTIHSGAVPAEAAGALDAWSAAEAPDPGTVRELVRALGAEVPTSTSLLGLRVSRETAEGGPGVTVLALFGEVAVAI